MVGGPYRIGQGTLQNWSGDPLGGPEVVGGPTRRSGSDRGILPEVRKWSGDPLLGLEVVGGPIRRSGNGRGTLPEVQK